MASQPKTRYTPEEYLALERSSDAKHEYHNGEIFAMSGASKWHVSIVTNLVVELGSQLKAGPCTVYSTDLRVRVAPDGLYTYPDVIVLCDEPRFSDEQQDTLLNPALIIEVLSESTEGYDRGAKAAHYRRIPSLREYVLVSQGEPRIEVQRRSPGGGWELLEARPGETIELVSLGVRLDVAAVYANPLDEAARE